MAENLPPSPINTIIFDLGSTLIYFDGDWPAMMQQGYHQLWETLHQAGLQLEQRRFIDEFHERLEAYYIERDTEFIEHSTAYILKTLLAKHGYPEPPEPLIRTALVHLYSASEAHWQPEADAIPTLTALRQRGCRLGMISNASDDANVQRLVDQAELRPFFEIILSSAAEGIRKPNPLLFQRALQRLGALPEQALMVGDNLGADILGARSIGMKTAWITRRADTQANRSHEDTIQADYVITTLAQLLTIL